MLGVENVPTLPKLTQKCYNPECHRFWWKHITWAWSASASFKLKHTYTPSTHVLYIYTLLPLAVTVDWCMRKVKVLTIRWITAVYSLLQTWRLGLSCLSSHWWVFTLHIFCLLRIISSYFRPDSGWIWSRLYRAAFIHESV